MREIRDVMGMPVTVDVRDGAADPELAFAWLREVDPVFSTYRDDSEIRRLDRGELRSPTAAPRSTRC